MKIQQQKSKTHIWVDTLRQDSFKKLFSSKDFSQTFEKLFSKQQIFINRFICLNYIKTLAHINKGQNICEQGKSVVKGINKQEVVSISREPKRKGFFEKLFHFFK